MKRTVSWSLILTAAVALVASGCASSRKKTTPELSNYEGKKVALVEVEGESTQTAIVEVALVNQLIKRGTFILVSKKEIDQARTQVGTDTSDWKAFAKAAGADIALRAKVIQFDADTHEGYSSEIVDDSQMAAERGEAHRKVEKVFKVKALRGRVQVELQFATLTGDNAGDLRYAVAQANEDVQESANKSAIHLPPKLRFLEKLTNQAFAKFFDQYN
ncbi:MAG: hypothetical protein JNL01_07585 [Bdellovibrionales bacterium]|nr:hypothetical protein [Bdellovibrionales bacterium]